MASKYFRSAFCTILLITLSSISGCFNEEEGSSFNNNDLGKEISCLNLNSLPKKHHCLSFQNETAPTFYGLNSLFGSWTERSGDFCITYFLDGTGVIEYSGKGFTNTGFSPNSNYTNILWGVLINKDGSFAKSNDGHVYVLHENLGPGAVDTQIVLLAFDERNKKFYGWDLNYGACNIGTNSNDNNATTPGRVLFWSKRTQDGNISVRLNNTSKPVYFYSTQPDNCNNLATAFSLKPGAYNFVATATYTNTKWQGTVTVNENTCHLFELY